MILKADNPRSVIKVQSSIVQSSRKFLSLSRKWAQKRNWPRAIARGDALKVVDEVLEFCRQPRTDEGEMGLDLSKSTLY